MAKTDKDIKTDLKCSVAGWGAIKTNGSANSLLLQADVVILKTEMCKKEWKREFTAKMLCAGGSSGFCQVSAKTTFMLSIKTTMHCSQEKPAVSL